MLWLKSRIPRTPLEWSILILPSSGFPSAHLHEMEGTGLQRSHTKGHAGSFSCSYARKTCCHVCLSACLLYYRVSGNIMKFDGALWRDRAADTDIHFPKAKHSSFTDDPLEAWRVSGNGASMFGVYSPMTATWKVKAYQSKYTDCQAVTCSSQHGWHWVWRFCPSSESTKMALMWLSVCGRRLAGLLCPCAFC